MSATRTHPPDDVLHDFLLGKLPDLEEAEVEDHLAECPECQQRASTARVGDTLVELLASAGTRLDAERAAAPTPTFSGAATPSLFANTQMWDGTPGSAPDPTVAGEIPAVLIGHPKYRVLRRLGEGGMGTVWLAEHTVMNRSVAVKVIRPELLTKPGATGRFLREVRAAAKLHHANIVTAYDAEPVGESFLFVMEFVEGETLAERLKAGPHSVTEACRAIRDAARGLAHAHAAGLVHRDVKPHNLIRATDGTVKVLDFGLAGVAVGEGIAAVGDGLTGAGMVCGTPDYIAPEQITDPHAADARSDIYGLGCTLYHLLAGRAPFAGGTVIEKLDSQKNKTPEPIPSLAPELAAVLTKMLAKCPEDRYQTAEEVAAALEGVRARVGHTPPSAKVPVKEPRSRRWAVIAAAVLFVGVLAAGVVFKIQRDNQEITIATDDPDIEVVMKRKGEVVRVIDHKSGQTWDIDTSTNQIGLADTPAGLRFELPEGAAVVMKRNGEKGGKPVFTVTRSPRPDESDRQRILGSWVAVAAEMDGLPAPRELLDSLKPTMTFTQEKVIARPGGVVPKDLLDLAAKRGLLPRNLAGFLEWGIEGIYHIDPTKAPKTIDITILGDEVRRNGLGLYSLEGDTLKLCLSLNPEKISERPTAFSSKAQAGTLRVIVTFKRQEPEKVGEVRVFKGHKAPVWSVALSRDERRGFSCSEDGYVRCWDLRTGAELWTYEVKTRPGGRKFLRDIAISPDGTRALVACYDHTVRVLDTANGKEVGQFKGHKTWIQGVSFSSDGCHALSASHNWEPSSEQDNSVRMWEVATGKEVQRFEVKEPVEVKTPDEVRTQAVNSKTAIFSRDDRLVLTADVDGCVRVWDIKTGKELRKFEGHDLNVLGLALSSDGTRLLTGGYDKMVRLWDFKTGKELCKFEGHSQKIQTVAFTADARRALSASEDGTVRLWNVDTGKEVYRCEEHIGRVYTAAITRDGRYALSGGQDGTVRLWRLPDPVPEKVGEVRKFGGPAQTANRVAISPDGRFVAVTYSGSFRAETEGWIETPNMDFSVRLYEIATGLEVQKFTGHTHGVVGVAFSKDGTQLLSGSHDSTLRLWDVKTGKELQTIQAGDWRVRNVALSPDGKYALSADHNQTVRLWSTETGKEVRQYLKHAAGLETATFSADGRHVLFNGDNSRIAFICETESGKEVRRFTGHTEAILHAVYSPGEREIATAGKDGTVRLWNAETGTELQRFTYGTVVNTVAFTPDGDRLLAGGDDGDLRLWDVASGKQLHVFSGHTAPVHSVAITPNGRFAVSASRDETVRLWRLPDPVPEKVGLIHDVRWPGEKPILYYTAVSPDGRYFLAGTDFWASTTAVWETATGRLMTTILAPAGAVFLPDGKHVLAAGRDQRLVVWDVLGDREVRKFEAHPASGGFLSLSDDGARAVSTDPLKPETLVVWNVETGRPVAEWKPGHEGIFIARVSPDGKRVATVGLEDRTAKLWDVAEKKVLKTWMSKEKQIYGFITFLPGGRRFLTAVDQTGQFARFDEGSDAPKWLPDVRFKDGMGVSADGRYALVGDGTRMVARYDLETGRETGRIELPTDASGYMSLAPDGRTGVALSPQTGAGHVYVFRFPKPAPKP
jgi:uncharacterized protein (TIGR03067 family)